MKKLIFILPVFLMTSCIKKIVENTLGEVKDRQCECTYTATGKTEKKESTTIKNKNMFDGEMDCDKLTSKYNSDLYYGTCILQN
jgi:hypothetical protein